MGAECLSRRCTFLAISLVLLMFAAPLTSLAPTVEELSEIPEVSPTAPFNSGHGEQLAGEMLVINATDWLVEATRGLDRWDSTSISSSVTFDHVDLARDDRGRARGCLHDSAGGLWVARLEFGGGTSVTQIEAGSQSAHGNHCSIAVDQREKLHIAFTDDNGNLRVGYELSEETSSGRTWNIRTVEDQHTVAGITLLLGPDGEHNILWVDDTAQLWYSTFTTWWTHTPLLSGTEVATDYDSWLEPDGELNLLYRNLGSSQLIHGIMDVSGGWTLTTIDSGTDVGPALAFAKDSATGNVQYAYAISDSNSIRVVRDLSGQEAGRLHPNPVTVASGPTDTDFAKQAINTLDLDCDGVDDLIVSEPGANADIGAVRIFWGSSSGLSEFSTNLTGVISSERFGASIADAGDVDGDGCGDLLVGATGGQDNLGYTTGAAFIYHGGNRTISAANWTHTGDTGASANLDEFGGRVSSAGDVNDDGYDDILVTSLGYENNGGLGRVYLYLGGANGLAATPIWNTRGYWSNVIQGWSIAAIGDSNGDGFDDIAIGASSDMSDISGYGRVQVYHGAASGAMTVDNQWYHQITYTFLGYSVAGLGDLNGDNYTDFAFGEPNHDSSAYGKVHVFLGSADGYGEAPDLELVGTQTGQLLGSAISTIGDLNDDGKEEVAISSIGLGNSPGKVELFYADSEQLLRPAVNPILIEGVLGQHLGETVSGGGDVDGDGELEILVTSSHKDMDGSDAGVAVQLEKRNFERADISKAVGSIDLDLDDQGRLHLLVSDQSGSTHLERPNAALDPNEPWRESSLSSGASSMVVTRAGKTVILDDTLSFHEQSANVLVSVDHPMTVNTIHDLDLAIIDEQSQIFYTEEHNSSTSYTKVRGETDSGFLTNALNDNSTSVLAFNSTSALTGHDIGSSCQFWNGTVAFVRVMDNQTVVTYYEDQNSSTYILSTAAALAVDTACRTNDNLLVALQTPSSIELLEYDDGINSLASDSMSVTSGEALIVNPSTGTALFADSTGGHLLCDSSNSCTGITGLTGVEVESVATGADGTVWILHDGGNSMTTLSILDGATVLDVWTYRASATSQLVLADMEVDSDGVVRFVVVETDGSLHSMSSFRIYGDWDRDFVPSPWDDVAFVGGQWDDSDGDGYGDNADGPVVDSCPTASGSSRWGYFGCADYEGDGWANVIDLCIDRAGHSWIDRVGCPDPDGDGWSSGDETTSPGSADADPLNWFQAQDSDADNRLDNHGPECCGPDGSKDDFPLNGNQWADEDNDGWGDQSDYALGNLSLQQQYGRDFGHDDIPNTNDGDGSEGDGIYDYFDTDWGGDQCPEERGFSVYDRGGCIDTDGDGWSDPHHSTGPNDSDWLYNRTVCHGLSSDGHNGCADNWPGVNTSGEPCSDLANCSQQWHDFDGDGYGDNSTYDAWRQDAFPDDETQWNDTDLDGYGDNQDEGATTPDACTVNWGNSTDDRLGCPDTDGDGWSDADSAESAHPIGNADSNSTNPEQWRDTDGDGFGDFSDLLNGDKCPTEFGYLLGEGGRGCPLPAQDQDGDGIIDDDDICANTTMGETVETSGPWTGCSENQKDDDGDGVSNAIDRCANTTAGALVDEYGCSSEQLTLDSDSDGIPDIDDICPDTEEGAIIDQDGCAPEQLDEDDDGVSNALDDCPGTAEGAVVDEVGCPRSDMDSDGDGHSDDIDAFPADPSQWGDYDGDGFGDNLSGTQGDECPTEPGNSTGPLDGDRWGCPDSDGDGWSDPSGSYQAEDGADAFVDEPTQWRDSDGDGFGDNKDGFEADECPLEAGIRVGVRGMGCPAATTEGGETFNACDEAEVIYDPATWGGRAQDVPSTYHTCEWYETWYGEPESSGPDMVLIGGIGAALLVLLLLTLVIVRLFRGGEDWDDDEFDDDLFDDEPRQKRSGTSAWSVPGSTQDFSDGFGGDGGGRDTRGVGRPGPSRGPSGPTPGRGGPSPSRGGPARGPSGPSRRPGAGGGPTRRSAAPEAAASKRVSRKRVVVDEDPEPATPTRKVRKTLTESSSAKATRKTRAKKPSASSWQDLFTPSDSANYERSLGLTREAIAAGNDDRTMLRTLQTDGWTAKQSRWIVDDARNN